VCSFELTKIQTTQSLKPALPEVVWLFQPLSAMGSLKGSMDQLPPATSHRSLRGVLREGIAHLESARLASASLAAELLLMHTLGRDRTWLYSHPEEELGAATCDTYFFLIARRASGLPTQHLTGHQEFWGLDFEVTRDVLIPRPETEHVIEVALQRLGVDAAGAASPRDAEMRIADVGTGSGCIAIALANELPKAYFVATDISAAALEVARRNAARHGVAARIEFAECSLLDRFLPESQVSQRSRSGQSNHSSRSLRASESLLFHAVVSNPPYVSRKEAATLAREVREHEPDAALFGGEAGTEMYAPLIAQAAAVLIPGGVLVLELGYNAAEEVSRLLQAREWSEVSISSDLAGIKRVASARRTALTGKQ
jgi:release factor glutamine methyltransferase